MAVKTLIVFFAVALLFNAQESKAEESKAEDENRPIRPMAIVYLGTSSDGKSFFSERAEPRTWAQANDFCKAARMNLASITNADQMNLVKTATGGVSTPGSHYWTAGRDSLTLGQVAWDFNGESPAEGLVRFEAAVSHHSCLSFVPTQYSNYGYHLHACTETYGTLCEIHPNSGNSLILKILMAQSVRLTEKDFDNAPTGSVV